MCLELCKQSAPNYSITQKQVARKLKMEYLMVKMPKQQLTVNMTQATAEALDKHLEGSPYNRSTYIEVAVKEKLEREKVLP